MVAAKGPGFNSPGFLFLTRLKVNMENNIRHGVKQLRPNNPVVLKLKSSGIDITPYQKENKWPVD